MKITKRKFSEIIIPLSIFLLVFLGLSHRLDYSSLHPWDEAWYASVTQNLLNNNNLIDLSYNDKPFWDHPPLGFHLMFLSVKVFGNNEFAIRLPSVIFACLSIVLVYLFNKKTINIGAGLQSALILFSTRWFLLRSRTGNLDMLLIFFQLLTFYCLYFSKTKKQIFITWFIYGLAMLSKSSFSIVLLPLLLAKSVVLLKNNSWTKKEILYIIGCFLLPLIPWYGYNSIIYGLPFLNRNLLAVGLRNGSGHISLYGSKLFVLYFRSMVHKWFYPLVISLSLGILLIKKKEIKYIFGYFFVIAIPLFISGQAAIWHLIPLAAPMALLIPQIINELVIVASKRLKAFSFLPIWLANTTITLLIFLIAGYSWESYIPELYSTNKFSSTPTLLAQKAKEYPGYIIIDEFNDYPTTINYYANKHTELLRDLPQKSISPHLVRPFILITNQNFVDNLDQYQDCNLTYSYETYRLVTCN